MKKLSAFQKQAVGLLAMVLVAAILYGIYLFRPTDKDKAPAPVSFLTAAEEKALAAFEGTAVFTFSEKADTKETESLTLMVLALAYQEESNKISAVYGKGDKKMSLAVNGKEAELGELFLYLEDGTAYATSARVAINKALFGDALDAENFPLSGYDLDGDKTNQAGSAYLYGPVEREDVEAIYVRNEHGEMIFVQNGSSYVIDGSMHMNVDIAMAATLFASCRAPVAVEKIKDIKDLADYGLDSEENSLATVIVTTKDDQTFAMRIGKELPSNGGFYAFVEGKEHVYVLMDSIKNTVLLPREEFLSADYALKLSEDNEIYKYIDNIEVSFDNGDVYKAEYMTEEERESRNFNYVWKVTAPDRLIQSSLGYALPNYFNLSDIVLSLCNLSSEDIFAADVTDSALKEYGLDKPYRVYSFDNTKNETVRITVYMSKPDAKGDFYVYSTKDDGKTKLTCGIGKLNVSKFIYINYGITEYLDNYLYLDFIDNVDEMTFVRGENSYNFVFGKNADLDITSAYLNGKVSDIQSCKMLYQSFVQCYKRGEHPLDSNAKLDMTVTIKDGDGVDTVFEFRRLTSVKVHVSINGEGNYYINYTDYEKLVNRLEYIAEGGIVER